MTESSKLVKKEYSKVRFALKEEITLAVKNNKREIIFDPRKYTTIEDPEVIRRFRARAGLEASSLPQVENVTWGRIKNLYECTCHENCRTVKVILRRDNLRCGERCDIWAYTINKIVFAKCRYCNPHKCRCKRWRMRRKYKIKDHDMILCIVFKHFKRVHYLI